MAHGQHSRRRRTNAGLLALLVAGLVGAIVLGVVVRDTRESRLGVATTRSGFPVGISYGDALRTMSSRELSDALDDAVDLHANWIRIDLSWASLQVEAGSAERWDEIDPVVRAARRRGLEVLGILTYTPAWARDPGCERFNCPPRSSAEFAEFAAAAATHFRGRIKAYEIWNEPNLARFWPDPDPGRYARLLAKTVPAVRDADQDADVLLGGLAARDTSPDAVAPQEFVTTACATGACADLTGVGYHPYTFPATAFTQGGINPTAWERITTASSWGDPLADVVGSVVPGAHPIWITEYGAPGSADPAACRCVSEEQQAAIVRSGLEAGRKDAAIGAVFIYTWKDLGDGDDPEEHYGLRTADGEEKPAFSAFADAARP